MGGPKLVDVPRKRGRCERAVADTLRHARTEGALDPAMDAALMALARTLGQAVDEAAERRDHFKLRGLAVELRETVAALRLDPASRGATKDDPFAALLADIATPSSAA